MKNLLIINYKKKILKVKTILKILIIKTRY